MTVFKGCMRLVQKRFGAIIMYFGIFLGIICMLNQVNVSEGSEQFSAEKTDLAVVDLDRSALSKELVSHLKKRHNVSIEKDDKSKLSEELYYGKKDVVLRIEKGFSEKAADGEEAVGMTQRSGSYAGIYLKQQINQFLEDVLMYHSLGYSIEESSKRVAAQPEAEVNMKDVNGNGGKVPAYSFFFMYFPYLFLSALGVALGKMLVSFRKKTVRARMMSSPLSLLQQNVQAILAFVTVGTLLYAFCLLVAVAMYGEKLLTDSNFLYYVLNGYITLLIAVEIAYIVGLIVKKESLLDMVIVPAALAVSFLCGVFVPLSVLSKPICRIASFLPFYWYEKVNTILAEHADISGRIAKQFWEGIGIQFVFLLALGGIAMAIAKYQQQGKTVR